MSFMLADGTRKQTQTNQELHLSELRYRRLFETAHDGILILDAATGQIIDVNPFVKEMLGYTQAQLLGKELWQVEIFNGVVSTKESFEKLQKKKYFHYDNITLKTKYGHSVIVEFICNVYLVGNQKVVQCNIRDITGRRKAEKLAESKTEELERLSVIRERTNQAMLNVMEDLKEAKTEMELEKVKDEAMLASIGEGLIAVDTDRKIMVVNAAAEKMLGWKIKEMINKEVTSLPLQNEHGEVLPLDQRPTYLALKSGKAISGIYFFVRKDKTKFPISIQVTPIKLEGKIIGALDVFRDITREKEIDTAKSEFVSLASHQLRTPLGIMKWYLEALESEASFKKIPTVLKKYVDQIYKSNERVLALVRDLLSVSRIDQGKVKNIPEIVDPLEVIKECLKLMQILADKKKVKLHLRVRNLQLPKISIDKLRFYEAVENLIENAIEYTVDSDPIYIQVSTEGKELSISVKDAGIGISASDQKKLFTKFFRSESAVEHNPEGSGLGLYVVKSYVEDWGGKVGVTSRQGKGSTFTINLPFSPNT